MQDFIAKLQTIYPEPRLLLDPADRWTYGYDYSRRHFMPDVVVFPKDSDEVSNTIKYCYEFAMPVVPRGNATGATGGCVPIKGGVVMCFEHMNGLEIDTENRIIIAQPGVLNSQVQQLAAKHGFFWAPDPTSSAHCSIGGNLAVNSSGPRAVKYGTCRENTLGLMAVTGTGEILKTGVYTSKTSVGYDLTRLLIGAEGTLAVITEANLKLLPKPDCIQTISAFYSDIKLATVAITNIMRQATIPCALEFMDEACLKIIAKASNFIPEKAKALLIIEVDGNQNNIDHMAQDVIQVCDSAIQVSTTRDNYEAQQLWKLRKSLAPALRQIAPKKINEDVVVPIANLPKLIKQLKLISSKYQLPIVNFGHAGNGNVHVNILLDPDDPIQAKNAGLALNEIFDLVISLNGTLSGEHGIGIEKQLYITKELQPSAIQIMQQIKQIFDPKNIINPGKIFPQLAD